MGTWIDEIKPFGDVLEIGPSCGSIGSLPLKSRTTIDHWQSQLSSSGTFDLILLHGYIGMEKRDLGGGLLVQEGKKTLEKVKETIPELSSIKYSNSVLQSFCDEIGEGQKEQLTPFLSELCKNGQITIEQVENVSKKFGLKVNVKNEKSDHLFECVQECLKHMRKGSRLSCQIGCTSRYEDPEFFEHIIANPTLDYREIACGNAHFMIIEKLD